MTNLQNYVEARSGMIERETKPREKGLNYIRAPKVLGQYFTDYLTCYGALTDIIKIGTNQLTFIPETEIKKVIAQSHSHGVRVALGNPIMDQALSAGTQATKEVIDFAAGLGIDVIRVACCRPLGRSGNHEGRRPWRRLGAHTLWLGYRLVPV